MNVDRISFFSWRFAPILLAASLALPLAQSARAADALNQSENSSSLVVGSDPSLSFPKARFQTSLYSQNTVDDRTSNFVTETRLRETLVALPADLSIHAGLWFIQDTRSQANLVYSDNQVSPFAGLQWHRLQSPIAVTLDGLRIFPNRADSNSTSTAADPEWALRLNAFHSDLFEATSSPLFLETYSSALFATRIEANVIFEHWTKAGLRYRPHLNVFLDLYSEVRAHANTRGWAWENYADLRGGGRAGYQRGPIAIWIAATKRITPALGYDTAPLIGNLVIGAEL